jgi:hypothetical protein
MPTVAHGCGNGQDASTVLNSVVGDSVLSSPVLSGAPADLRTDLEPSVPCIDIMIEVGRTMRSAVLMLFLVSPVLGQEVAPAPVLEVASMRPRQGRLNRLFTFSSAGRRAI